jgi:hypothetical protein
VVPSTNLCTLEPLFCSHMPYPALCFAHARPKAPAIRLQLVVSACNVCHCVSTPPVTLRMAWRSR